MSKITDVVTELVLPITEEVGVSLWDVEYVRTGSENYLRILIDNENGVSIDQCEAVSKALDPLLDEVDIINDSFILEVASAGIERSLKKPEHFLKYEGSLIEVKLYAAVDGSKRYVGILSSFNDDSISLETDRETLTIPLEKIARANLKYNWQ
ncbi:MAG: ribosome maturation factor RimP [Clostridiales bacterium]|nr:ribosome maturation factor RimP [Clostridiales bacterium]